MKPVDQSPFAAMDPREQKEQWICWQAARSREAAQPEPLPELSPPRCEKPAVPPAPRPRHGQYDAIIRRMKDARRRAECDCRWD